ncbi:MAG TPA: hypothetical protein PKX00_24120, partial [Opitutaceae bacterium]|nr:hypothetical protein [Opitutaceae bacterium]
GLDLARRMAGRQVLRKELLEGDRTLFAGLALLEIGTRLVIEVSLTGDIRILERIRPGAKLTGAALGNGFQIRNLRFECLQSGPTLEEAQHGADFARGTTCDIEESEKFVGGASLESLSDVVRDREGSAIQLVTLGPGDLFFGGLDKILTTFRESYRLPPDRQVLEALEGGHG